MIFGAIMDSGVDYLLVVADTKEIATEKAVTIAQARGWQFDGLLDAEELLKGQYRGAAILSGL